MLANRAAFLPQGRDQISSKNNRSSLEKDGTSLDRGAEVSNQVASWEYDAESDPSGSGKRVSHSNPDFAWDTKKGYDEGNK